MNKTGITATAIGFAALLALAIGLGDRPSEIRPSHTPTTYTSLIPKPTHHLVTTPKVTPAVKVTKATVRRQTGPSAADYRELRAARASSGMICHLEYDGPGNGYEAICTPPRVCKGVPDDLMTACITLYHRKPESHTNTDGSRISNPAGPVLVQECTSQYTDPAELRPCLTQPHI